MNILKTFRNPYLSILLSSFILFVSCGQDSLQIENNFDYSAFNKFKNNSSFENIKQIIQSNNFKKKLYNSTLETNKIILNVVNSEFKTKIELPDLTLQLTDYTSEQILDISLKNKWVNERDITLIKLLLNDIEAFGFEKAIKNYENNTFNMRLSNKEFSKKNLFLNMIKSINHENPNLFKLKSLDNTVQAKSWLKCAASSIALAAAIVASSSCVTIVACGVAIACLYAASTSVADNCFN